MTDTEFRDRFKQALALRNNYTEVHYLEQTKDECAVIQLDEGGNSYSGTVYWDHEEGDFEEDFLRFAVEAWRLWPDIVNRLGKAL